MAIAYKLADRHPNLEFWRQLPVRKQLDSLVMMWAAQVRLKLTREFSNYEERLKMQSRIKVDEPSRTYTIGENKIGEDFKQKAKKPKNILEFCR